jgi:TPR repeat protein
LQLINNSGAKLGGLNMRYFFTFAVVLSLSSTSLADPFEQAMSLLDAQDYPSAFVQFEALAKQGNVNAQSYLAFMYENGRGTPKNNELMRYWYQKAAEQGDLYAQSYLNFIDANTVSAP